MKTQNTATDYNLSLYLLIIIVTKTILKLLQYGTK